MMDILCKTASRYEINSIIPIKGSAPQRHIIGMTDRVMCVTHSFVKCRNLEASFPFSVFLSLSILRKLFCYFWYGCILFSSFSTAGGKLVDLDLSTINATTRINNLCNKNILLTSYHPWDIITTPNYPDRYPNNLNCTINVSVVGNFMTEILFTDFVLENGGERYFPITYLTTLFCLLTTRDTPS